jgi:hypothetical protein
MVCLSEVRGERIAGVSRTGLSSESGRGRDDSASWYYVTTWGRLEHPNKCRSVRQLCPTARATRR